jgi:F-type H+-transporting ATPase subunit alpha
VFFLHSRLLERAAKLHKDLGSGSMTALPIIETQLGDVSAYIPTNVISITDGQIFLDNDLFYQGIRPAVDVGISVSRVGGSAQIKAMKKVAGPLRLDLAQYRSLAAYAKLSADELDKQSREQLARGARLTEILNQRQFEVMPVEKQVAILYAATQGHLDDIEVEDIKDFENKFHDYVTANHPDIHKEIKEKQALSDELNTKLDETIKKFKEDFLAAKSA